MKKEDAIELMGGNISRMARNMGISRYTIHRWPDELPLPIKDQVIGAYMRVAEERDKAVTHLLGG